jgi:hypothetical protein
VYGWLAEKSSSVVGGIVLGAWFGQISWLQIDSKKGACACIWLNEVLVPGSGVLGYGVCIRIFQFVLPIWSL